MQDEIWKDTDVDGYIVSNRGNVKNKKTGHLIAPTVRHDYLSEIAVLTQLANLSIIISSDVIICSLCC